MTPRDPRVGGDGPAAFLIDANYDLTSDSAAIDAGDPNLIASYDFLYRSRVPVAG